MSIGIIYLSRTIYQASLKLLGEAFLSYQMHKVWETDMTFNLDLWLTGLNINRDQLLIKDFIPLNFEASGIKCSWVISCERLRETDIPTDRPMDMCKAICPAFSKGHKYVCCWYNNTYYYSGTFDSSSIVYRFDTIQTLLLEGTCKEITRNAFNSIFTNSALLNLFSLLVVFGKFYNDTEE